MVTEAAADKHECARLGLIVNPVAGLGGRVGLKGSDGVEIQRKAIELGGVSFSQERASEALERIGARGKLELFTWPGEMGERVAVSSGINPTVLGSIKSGGTLPDDTRSAAEEMLNSGVNLLLFAGGDGTARDIYDSVGDRIPVLGIPAGVKIHSAVFATTPRSAGDLASLFLERRISSLKDAEVIDIDEEALRQGKINARLYGYLKIPYRTSLVQNLKSPSPAGELSSMNAIAEEVVSRMEEGVLYMIGPGTTTRAIMSALELEKTLIGVDVVKDGKLVATDANEATLLSLIDECQARIVVTPIGGQGCIFGRGNQQISPEVIRRTGRQNVIVVATPEKIHSLGEIKLWVDTGDRELDSELAGYCRVITGRNEEVVCRIEL